MSERLTAERLHELGRSLEPMFELDEMTIEAGELTALVNMALAAPLQGTGRLEGLRPDIRESIERQLVRHDKAERGEYKYKRSDNIVLRVEQARTLLSSPSTVDVGWSYDLPDKPGYWWTQSPGSGRLFAVCIVIEEGVVYKEGFRVTPHHVPQLYWHPGPISVPPLPSSQDEVTG